MDLLVQKEGHSFIQVSSSEGESQLVAPRQSTHIYQPPLSWQDGPDRARHAG